MNRQKLFLALLLTVGVLFVGSTDGKSEQKEEVRTGKSIAVGKGPDAMFLTPDENFLYIANVEDSFISVIDTRKDEVVATIDGTDYPWGFTRLGKSNLVAVSGWDKGVDVIDFTTHKIVRSKRFEQYLGGIASTKDGKLLFVIAADDNKAFKIDAESLEILDEYATGNGPDGVDLSKDGSKIYVTNTKDGAISIINLKTKKAKLIETGGKPELIHTNQNHSLLYISNFHKNKIHILDTNTDKVIHEITGLDGPGEAVLSKSEETLYVVNFNNSKVYSYNTKTYEKLPQEFAVGAKPIGVVSAVNDSKLYVTNYGDNSVSVIKLITDFSNDKINENKKETDLEEILVKFKTGVDESQVKALASEVGLKQVKTIPELNLRVFKITSRKNLQEVIAVCQKKPFVEYAEPNQKVGIQK